MMLNLIWFIEFCKDLIVKNILWGKIYLGFYDILIYLWVDISNGYINVYDFIYIDVGSSDYYF